MRKRGVMCPLCRTYYGNCRGECGIQARTEIASCLCPECLRNAVNWASSPRIFYDRQNCPLIPEEMKREFTRYALLMKLRREG